MLIFAEGRKPENPEKNPRSKGESTTNSIHILRRVRELMPSLERVSRSLSPVFLDVLTQEVQHKKLYGFREAFEIRIGISHFESKLPSVLYQKYFTSTAECMSSLAMNCTLMAIFLAEPPRLEKFTDRG
jgi:hypothetical protein